MKKILVILFSLICIAVYPQKKNEYGQKIVKNIRCYEKASDTGVLYQITYDNNNHTNSIKTYTVDSKGNIISDFHKGYVLENGKLVYYMDWGQGNGIEKTTNQFIFNGKGHLTQEIQLFPAEKEVWNYYYDKDASIYDENLLKVEYVETDRNGNYFTGPMGNKVKPFIVEEYDYSKPPKFNIVEYKDFNDTNISLYHFTRGNTNDILKFTTWVPCYNPWLPIKDKRENQYLKYEYYNDENDNLSKIIVYELCGEIYKIERKIEIEYLY